MHLLTDCLKGSCKTSNVLVNAENQLQDFCTIPFSPNKQNEKRIDRGNKADSQVRVLFATSALGMGVDVTKVIHISPPSNLESYMQEIGRAGRTGIQSHLHCIPITLILEKTRVILRILQGTTADKPILA